MTGLVLLETSDGIYDDGEWISWAYLNQQIEAVERRGQPQLRRNSKRLERLLREAKAWHEKHGEVSGALCGEIGEVYAEEFFSLKRHKRHAQGSDGKIGNALVEVKTITPDNRKQRVRVKRAGNFGQLIVVRIAADYSCEAVLVQRTLLKKGPGRWATLSWSTIAQSGIG